MITSRPAQSARITTQAYFVLVGYPAIIARSTSKHRVGGLPAPGGGCAR